MNGKLPFGASSSKTTVASSVAWAPPFDSTPVNAESALPPVLGSAWKLNVAATSCAVIGLPSWNFTPWRILNVHCEASALGSQLSASRGTALSSRSEKIRYSPDCPRMARAPWFWTMIGLRSLPGIWSPVLRAPPVWMSSLLTGAPPVLGSFSPLPHALARNPTSGSDIPMTVPRRMNSRRPM